jgi:hypothetical protein
VAGSGLAGGLGYRRLNVLTGGLDVEVAGKMSVRRYQDYRAAIGILDARGSTLELSTADSKVSSLFNASSLKAPGSAVYIETRFRDYPEHTYYGAGIDSREDDRSDYALWGTSVEGVWQWQVSPKLGISARGGWLDLHVGTGHNDSLVDFEHRFASSNVPGATEQPRFVTFGTGVVYDTRLNSAAADDGQMIGVSLRRFAAPAAPELSFTRVTVDARGYRRTFSARGVLAARVLVSADLTRDNASTPFYLQQSLGGGDTLRSFHSYRFPDQALAHVTVEYRWRAHRFIEVAPFLDAGTVARGFSRLALDSLKASPGLSIRGRTDRRMLGFLDWAWSTEGHRVVVGMGPAF